MKLAEGIDKSVFDILVHPGAFNRQKATHVFIFLGTSDIDFLVAGVVVSKGHHMLAVIHPPIAVFKEGVVKAKLVVQAIVALSAIGEIDAVEDPVGEHQLKDTTLFVELFDIKAVVYTIGFNLSINANTTVAFFAAARIL